MSVLEIKGGIHEMIAQVRDEAFLVHLHETISAYIGQHQSTEDFWDNLSTEQQDLLNRALLESQDESQLLDNEEVFEKYKKWRTQ